MSKRVPFIVTEPSRNVDPFMLHMYAAVAQKERALISERSKAALKAAQSRATQLGGLRDYGREAKEAQSSGRGHWHRSSRSLRESQLARSRAS
nr:recombinase family protein [Bradyrhizobium acaciae]